MSRQSRFALAVTALLLCAAAHAELRFCNNTPVRLATAVGYRESDAWYARGWWRLWPGECATVVTGNLQQRRFYGHASAGDHSWSGPYSFCTSTQAFRIRDRDACDDDVSEFFEIDTGEETSWTTSFTCNGCRLPDIAYDADSHSIDVSHLTSFTTGGVKVHLPLQGRFDAQATADGIAIQMRLQADLEHLQQSIGTVLSQAADRSEECGERIHTYGASLQPRGSEAIFRARVRYEKWLCTSMDLPQLECEDTWIRVGPMRTKGIPRCTTRMDTTRTSKTRLLQQSGTVRIALSPVVTEGNAIRMRATVESVDLDGLGDFVAGILRVDLKNRAQSQLNHAVDNAKLTLAAPPELRPYISVDKAEFFDGGDSLRLRAVGSFIVTSATLAPLCQKLFDAEDCGVLGRF